MTWLLANASDSGRRALPQLARARVTARCGCGCACIDFRIKDTPRFAPPAAIEVVADFWWRTEFGYLCGASVFLVGGRLTGLDLWSIDGGSIPTALPGSYELWPYGSWEPAAWFAPRAAVIEQRMSWS